MEKNLFYKDNNIRLYNGDCLKIMQEMPANTFDMVFADPPYFLSGASFTCQKLIVDCSNVYKNIIQIGDIKWEKLML